MRTKRLCLQERRQEPNNKALHRTAVMAESRAVDPGAAQERLEALTDVPVLDVSEAAAKLADDLAQRLAIPT